MKEVTKRRAFLIFLYVISFIFLSSKQILAQNPPPEQEAGAQAERFKAQAEREKKQLEQKKTKIPGVEAPQKEEKAVVPSVAFVLREIKITGVTFFKPEDLRSIYQPLLNKEITLKDLESIAKVIESRYAKKGYLTTNAYIPEQDIKDGKVEIRVVEGKMGKLKIEGNKWFPSSLIEKFFHSKKNEILNVQDLQRDILRLNQNPDVEIKTIISAGEIPETSDITLQVKDKFPWHVGVSEDNQGTRLTGKYRTSYTLRSSNVTGRLDTLFEDTLFSKDSFGESVSYSIPLGTHGTKLSFDATFFKMKLGKEFKPFDIIGRSQIYTPYISWELALTENYQANANLGLDIKSIIKKENSITTFDDQLRLPWFGFDFTKQDLSGQTSFSPRFTFGTSDFLGASSRNHPSATRAGTGGFFFKYEQSLCRIQRMPLDSYISMRSQFQAVSHTLPSSEQIQLGGAYSVRGYPEGDYLADMGGALNADWLFPMYLIPGDWKLKNQNVPLRYQIQPVIFADCGAGKLKKVLPGEKYDQFLAGVGGGLQLNFNGGFSLRVEWAKAIGGDRPTSGSGPSTFYLTFQSEL